uniref:Zona-pellucida-binding protein 1/2 N-terminal domain-containing protein n=1 Tax=Chelonoidis abingdonii TaxID=106734 RepID=A0A8C0HJ45_CHEAB
SSSHWTGAANRGQWEPRSAGPADAASRQTGPASQGLSLHKRCPKFGKRCFTGKGGILFPVYVLINSKDLILKCLTQKLLKQRIIDPKYQWIGPIGLITKGNYIFNICSQFTPSNFTFALKIRFMVYGNIHLSSEFKTETCETNAVASFEKQLLENMENLIRDLQCEIRQWNTQCHAATDTMAMLTHKLTFQFVVSSFDSDSAPIEINAYTKIKQFFEVQNTESDHIHQIHYISGSLTGKKVDHCKPGFGKNINNSTLCPGCCGECLRLVWKLISNCLP